MSKINKPHKGADRRRCHRHAQLVAAYLQSQSQVCSVSQHGDFWIFRRSVTLTLTLTLDEAKITSVCAIHIGLPACPTT